MEDKLKSLKAEYFDCDVAVAQLGQKKQQILAEINKLLVAEQPKEEKPK